MDQDPHPYGALGSPPPPRGRRRRRVPRVAIAAGVTALLGLGGAGLAFGAGGGGGAPAASLSSSSSSSPGAGSVPKRPHVHPGRAGRLMPRLGAPGGRVLHAEYTVRDGTTFRTVTIQLGRVTSVSPTSITVLSADGYSRTYAIQPSTVVDSQNDGISSVAVKDQVRLQGLLQGSKRIATEITDVTKVGQSRHAFGLTRPPAPGPVPAPAPAPGVAA